MTFESLSKKQYVGFLSCASTIYVFETGILTWDMVLRAGFAILSSQITQAGVCFILAAWLHSKIVVRDFSRAKNQILDEMKAFSKTMTASIDGVAIALRADLATKAGRDEMQAEFDKVHGRIDALEKDV